MTTQQPKALELADRLEQFAPKDNPVALDFQAAAELRRLHEVNQELLGLVKRYRKETPLGHQPHMIAHLADDAIAKAQGDTP